MTETHICEHCGARSAVYRRKINRTMVIGLMYLLRGSESDAEAFWSLAQGDPTHHRSRDTTRLALWGLIEEERERRADGGRKGFWRITPNGVRFLYGYSSQPKYVYTLNGRVIDESEERVTVYDAYQERFDLREVLGTIDL